MGRLRSGMGWLLLLVGLAVFAIRLQHAGPYGFPQQGNLLAGVLALLGGLWLALGFGRAGVARAFDAVVCLGVPLVLFFALYAVLAEVEEVIVVRAPDLRGEMQDLRLWVVDDAGVPWATMPSWKSNDHGLDGRRLQMLRSGAYRCVVGARYEDRPTVNRIHRARHEIYAVQRLATAIGIFGEEAAPDTVAVRFDPCPPE